jgi:hypothetical protein
MRELRLEGLDGDGDGGRSGRAEGLSLPRVVIEELWERARRA